MTFTRAIEVAPGDPITARQLISLARAINDRQRSGIGDGHERLGWWWFNLFRQVRNPADGGFVFPAQGEFFDIYQHVEPKHGVQWPLTGPGDPQGANLANVMNQFVFGLAPYLGSEEDRLAWTVEGGLPMWLEDRAPQTLGEWWELAKYQRGAVDPESFVQSVPALETAQRHFEIVTPTYSPHGKTYGGYFPTPIELDPNCGTTEETGLGIASYQIFFTALSADVDTAGFHGTVGSNADGLPTITYAGTCPLDTEDTGAGHIIGSARLPFAIYVAVNDGAGGFHVDRFDRTEWIEGPYTGLGFLSREDGGQLHHALWQFANDFRGTPSERSDPDFRIQDVAFDFQAFFTRQYHLAPAKAVLSGGELAALYPTARIEAGPGGVAAAGFLVFTDDSTAHQYALDFVLSGCYLRAEHLLPGEPITLQFRDGDELLSQVTVEPASDGTLEDLVFFEDGPRPNLRIFLASGAQFTSPAGFIEAQANEILEYKPNWWDAYLLLRMSATRGGDPTQGGVDGSGVDFPNAPELFERYRDLGCIANFTTSSVRQQADWVNDNPVFDAARRLSRQMVRIVPRRQLASYEVSGGKSILRFHRFATNIPGVEEGTYDLFEGIAPPATALASGELVAGEEYVVAGTSGSITYRGSTYGPGARLVAAAEDLEFQEHGDCVLQVYNGIRHVALPAGWTNEWLMSLQTKVYHPSESSIWKAAAYADYFTWSNRCHFYSGTMFDGNFVRHTTYNSRPTVGLSDDGTHYQIGLLPPRAQADMIVVESPSGYNYAHNSNSSGPFVTDDFFRSCQIYKPPYEIESAVIETVNGQEIVKLTFTGRFQAHEDAPASVAADPMSWSSGQVQALRDESYRTCDNALREYTRHQADPAYHASWKIGDAGVGSSIQSQPDNPFGSVYPHFIFTRLIPEPYEDGNATLEKTDTRATIDALLQAEITERAMCEGFMDDRTSLEITCQTGFGSMYDFRFSTLCFKAFEGSYVGAFSLLDRADNPSGFGPMANTHMYGEVFTRLAKCVNELTRARVDLPFWVECRTAIYQGKESISPDWSKQDPPDCSTPALTPTGTYHIKWSGSPPAAGTEVEPFGDWVDCGGGAVADSSAGINQDECPVEHGPEFTMLTHRQISEYRVTVADRTRLAIPASWRNQIESLGGFIGISQEEITAAHALEVDQQADASGCCPQFAEPCAKTFWDGSTGWAFAAANELLNTSTCGVFDRGSLDAGTPPGGTFLAAREYYSGTLALCTNSSRAFKTVQILTEAGFYVSIPLVDLP